MIRIQRLSPKQKIVCAPVPARRQVSPMQPVRQGWDGMDLCPYKDDWVSANQVSDSWQKAARGIHQIHQQHSNRSSLPHLRCACCH